MPSLAMLLSLFWGNLTSAVAVILRTSHYAWLRPKNSKRPIKPAQRTHNKVNNVVSLRPNIHFTRPIKKVQISRSQIKLQQANLIEKLKKNTNTRKQTKKNNLLLTQKYKIKKHHQLDAPFPNRIEQKHTQTTPPNLLDIQLNSHVAQHKN